MDTIKDVQNKILEIMMFIDKTCRENDIVYYIMGGTALGAIRHNGFIPWDDDIDIFMTPQNYNKFKTIVEAMNSQLFVIQEWKETPNYVRHAKVRMNGTTFIESIFKDRPELHQGIFVDIMILHKMPLAHMKQRSIYYKSKYVTLWGNIVNGWKPKNSKQALAVSLAKILPNQFLLNHFYKSIYKYDDLADHYKWCYYITKGNFQSGMFNPDVFQKPVNIQFENITLYAPTKIKEYLSIRYGNYMEMPPLNDQKLAVHAMYYDTKEDYREYFKKKSVNSHLNSD